MSDTRESIILVGGGGHCRSVIDVIEQQGIHRIAGIIDMKVKVGCRVLGYPIIGDDDCLPDLRADYRYAVVTVGHIQTNSVRVQLFQRLKSLGFILPPIISPHAYVSQHAEIGEGTVVMHHVLVNVNAVVGRNCILNTKALIEHDAIVGDHCHISTGSVINGEVKVEANSFVGSNATSKQAAILSGFTKAGAVAK